MLGFLLFLITIITLIFLIKTKDSVEDNIENDQEILRLKLKLLPYFPELSNVKIYKGKKSYILNKKNMYICTSDKNGNSYDDNMLVFVILHELAHSLNSEIGHGEKFIKIFNELLKRAESYKLYDSNFPKVENYCQ